MLGGHGELRDGCGFTGLVRTAGLDEHGAAAGGAAAVVDDRQNFFVGEKLVEIFGELAAPGDLGHAERRALAGNFVFAGLGEVIVAETLVGSFGDGLHFGVGAEDRNHSRELAAIFVEVFFVFNGDANAFAGDHAVGAGGPGFGIDQERGDVGRHHANVGVLVSPSAAEWSPGFEVRIAQAHGSELVASPFVGALHVRGSSEALAD